MSEIRKVQHYHTKTPNNNPLATNMVDGEIAINMAADSEKLYIKNTNDEVVEFLPADKMQEKIDDLATIRSGAAKGATALQSVPAEYITETELNAKGYATTTALNNKVDKVSGKDLSTNDYTTAEKNKLSGIASGAEVNVQSDWNETNTSSDAYIKNKPTIPAAVTESTVSGWGFTKNSGTYSKPNGGIPKTDLASAVQTSLGKADTALQSYTEQYKGTVSTTDTSETIDDVYGTINLSAYATKTDLNTKQDKLVSGTNIKTINGHSLLGNGNITIEGGGSADLSNYLTKTEVATVAISGSYNDLKNKPTIPVNTDYSGTTETLHYAPATSASTISAGSNKYISGIVLDSKKHVISATTSTLPSFTEQYKGTVTSVSVSGANGLTGSGTVTSSGSVTISGVTATSGATGVSKLVTGDLKSKTYTNGEAAAAAHTHSQYLTGYTETYKGTITGVSVNGTSVATSGLANIPSASTSAYGVTKLTSSTSSTSTTLAATASAVKSAYDLANGKQDKLTSGTNIKTVNGQSLLGSGNITIEGGGNADANVGAVDTNDVIDDVNIEYCTRTYVDTLVGDINSVLESIINGGGSNPTI